MELMSYCKYFGSSEAVLDGVFDKWKIRFTQPWGLNDPLEGTPALQFARGSDEHSYEHDGITYPSERLFYRIQLVEALVNAYGMLSLTKISDSFQMWALYADGHRGFAIWFTEGFQNHSCMKGLDGQNYPIEPVTYVDEYAIDPDEFIENGKVDRERLVKAVFFRKTLRWKYEREYRMVRPLSDCGTYTAKPGLKTSYRDGGLYLFDLAPQCISSVVFGAHMSVEHKHFIYERVKDKGIALFQSCLLFQKDDDGHQGKLLLIPIEQFGNAEAFFQLQPQVFSSLDSEYSAPPKEKRQVDSLAELPYYQGFSTELEAYQAAILAKRKE